MSSRYRNTPRQKVAPNALSAKTQATFQQAMQLHQQGQLAQAQTLYNEVLKLQPEHFDALHLSGVAAYQTKNFQMAVELIGKAIEIQPNNTSVYYNLGLALYERGQFNDAVASYNQAIALKPDFAEAYCNRGVALQEMNQLDDAVASYDQTIALKPDYAEAYCNRGNALQELRQLADAVTSYDRAIALKHDYAEAYYNRGNALKELKQLHDAVASYDHAITLKPDFALAYNNRGNVLKELKQLDDAVASYDQTIALKPDFAEAYNNRGNTLLELRQLDDAVTSYDRAIALKPDYAEAYSNRGNALRQLKQPDNAVASYDQATALKPDYAEAYYNRGNALQELRQLDDAVASYDRAIALKPDYADACYNRGNALQELRRLNDALASYDQAITLKPDYGEAYCNRGNTLRELRELNDAVASYKEALALKPDGLFWLGMYLHTMMQICEWSALDFHVSQLTEKIEHHEKVSSPFPILAIADSLSLQKDAARIYVQEQYPATHEFSAIPMPPRHDKIRIGYYSADFHDHATMDLMAGLFETHDRSKFELIAFSFGPAKNDGMRTRVTSAFDRFIDVRTQSDRGVTLLSRELEIDIAVDLKGFTQDSRPGIFALRTAPIQINYLGYPGSMGAEYIDYLIADGTLIPESSRPYYSEKIVYLPDCYQVNDTQRSIADKVFTRKELGLPETGFVFCCFNNNYKITPATFDGWMRILKQTEGSVLWLLEDNVTAASNLRKEATERGVEADRLLFAKRMPLPEHLARHLHADLFLDTLPCNAHTTASDALWAGLPVLTCMGESFASRVAASLLNAIHLPELITSTQDEYEALAIELAISPEKSRLIREKLERNRLTTPLFNTQLFTQHIEEAYRMMYERYQADLPPDHLFIKASSSFVISSRR